MEPVPPDIFHDKSIRLADISKYCQQCYDVDYDPGTVMLATMELIQKRFSFDFEEARRIVHNSRYFDANDSAKVTCEKAAVAPLLLMDMYVEAAVDDKIVLDGTLEQRNEAQRERERIIDWYGDLATLVQGIASNVNHTTEQCCADGMIADEMICSQSTVCPLRIARSLLIESAFRVDFDTIQDDTDAAKQLVVVDAKLSAARDCEFITSDQKDALSSAYQARIASRKGSDE
jgi:hypothetical protein